MHTCMYVRMYVFIDPCFRKTEVNHGRGGRQHRSFDLKELLGNVNNDNNESHIDRKVKVDNL